jgi:hypothetical protein
MAIVVPLVSVSRTTLLSSEIEAWSVVASRKAFLAHSKQAHDPERNGP